ncbi:hypothetical protein CYLTODRAFT_424172 [Cylindrobasidium torrendii FP15055 ss-10]|uniref:Uncharacterized protein n=1 Tax=Cylindrobasidium torrendii FP15055 ss-10 TaxID=1314674 RepID=A0A0D7B620_9AGAR|nr:hypothetical protein CYLTODRAFT_424172 [Cylindrobasidium torrendii FP15055 ss-10]
MDSLEEELRAFRQPMRFVPDDVLTMIFAYAIPWCSGDGIAMESFPTSWDSETRLDLPWTLSHVCRNWRALCISLPRLWSTMYIRLPKSPGPGFGEKMDVIYHRRSEPIPLRLWIRKDAFKLDPLLPLLKSAHRWRCVRLALEYHGGFSHVDVFHDCLFPCLTHLSLQPCRTEKRIAYIQAPRLQKLELIGTPIRCKLSFPWDQFTWYKSTNSALEIIGFMKNLQEIVIEENGCWYHKEYKWDAEKIILPRVRRLEYGYVDDSDKRDLNSVGPSDSLQNIWLFTHYNFTSLQTLIIDDSYHAYDQRLATSLPSVIELSLCFGDANFIRGVLLATPNVQSLHIECDFDTESLLCPSPGQPSVSDLHSLKHLSFVFKSDSLDIMDFPAIDEAVTALKTHGLPLATISFYSGIQDDGSTVTQTQWTTCVRDGMADSLREWMDGGLRVQYHYDAEHRFP